MFFRLPIVNRRWRQQTYAAVTVLLVIPLKKTLTESTTVLDAPKAVRELRPIFRGSELALRERIVVRRDGGQLGGRGHHSFSSGSGIGRPAAPPLFLERQ